MLRKSRVIPIIFLDDFFQINPELAGSEIELRMDENNAEDIIKFLLETDKNGKLIHKKKFQRILYTVLSGHYNSELYDREEVSTKAKNVTAMKFKGKLNFRIGCKVITCTNKKVIMVSLFHKKTQKNSKKEIAIYEAIGGYDYEC